MRHLNGSLRFDTRTRARVVRIGQNRRVLAEADVERFVNEGYLVIRSAFSSDVAEECRRSAAQQLGIDLTRQDAWKRPAVRGVPTGDCFREAANAPRLLKAVAQLVDPDAW